jgi:inorganic pyrophosphatase
MSDFFMEVFVEIPKGNNNKYEFDKERGVFRLDRVLYSPVYYPADFGFLQDTLADDGDPLDAMVLTTFPTFPGCMIQARIIGMFIMEDEKGRDEKILGVPVRDPRFKKSMLLMILKAIYSKRWAISFPCIRTWKRRK